MCSSGDPLQSSQIVQPVERGSSIGIKAGDQRVHHVRVVSDCVCGLSPVRKEHLVMVSGGIPQKVGRFLGCQLLGITIFVKVDVLLHVVAVLETVSRIS